MKKKEKKSDLEQLLNSLIEKGFIPFNIPEITEIKYISTKNKLRITSHQNNIDYKDDFSLRDLVSKGSGLWQFVCENGMVKPIGSEIEIKNLNEGYGVVRDTDYQYRVIVSALCDEDKLEEFLLDNIKL